MVLSPTCSVWPSQNVLEFSDALPKGASLLWLLSTLTTPETDGLLTNISVIQTWRWFFALTPFESVFMAMIMLHILTLQVIGILPLNVNQLVHGSMTGRRKRGISVKGRCMHHINQELSGQILNIIHSVDKYGCVFRALCEAQKQTNLRVKLPDSIHLTLATLSSSNGCSKMSAAFSEKSKEDEINLTEKLLPLYQEAVDLGEVSSYSRNSTHCEDRYRNCPLGAEEILSYLHQMRLDDLF